MTRLLLILVLALAACSQPSVDRAEWQRMTHEDRLLYVQSLIGEEQAKAAKGGPPVRFDKRAEEYARAIDAAYARGDAREPRAVFAELGR